MVGELDQDVRDPASAPDQRTLHLRLGKGLDRSMGKPGANLGQGAWEAESVKRLYDKHRRVLGIRWANTSGPRNGTRRSHI
jgi:hypothetical protein